jgi:hypothetical protein
MKREVEMSLVHAARATLPSGPAWSTLPVPTNRTLEPLDPVPLLVLVASQDQPAQEDFVTFS